MQGGLTIEGVNNKILHVNLTDMKFSIEEPGKYSTGHILRRGFALKYMLENIPAGTDPLAPKI